ncbi:MAG: FAD-dependent oxidoreductase [Gemmatimonadales bacterium]|nr:FAD-dependent oxidoreductase [Gemmatimonadales bacterium]
MSKRSPSFAQLEADSLTGRLLDAVVIGAGPAGLTAALELAAADHDVAILEKQPFPRSKVCGDGLISDSIRMLRRLGLYEVVRSQGHALEAARLFSPSQYAVDIPGEFLTIRRDLFDTLLAQAAVGRGASFAVADVLGIEERPGRVLLRCRGTEARLAARLAVVATGADIRPIRSPAPSTPTQPSAVAVRCYARSSVSADRMIVSFDQSILPGYGWIFPLGNQEFNLGCGVFRRGRAGRKANLRTMFQAMLEFFPPAREVVANGALTSPLKGAPLRCGLRGVPTYAGGRVVAVGETTGTTFPFTGEGIGKAMETGALAADHVNTALAAGSLEPLERLPLAIQSALEPRYHGYNIAERWLSHPWVSDFLIKRAQGSEALRNAAAGVLNETVDPSAIFSWRGVVASLIR